MIYLFFIELIEMDRDHFFFKSRVYKKTDINRIYRDESCYVIEYGIPKKIAACIHVIICIHMS